MFEDLYKYVEDRVETASIRMFFDQIEDLPFYDEIRGYIASEGIDKNVTSGRLRIIDYILNTLEFGSLPKAVIKMIAYPDGSTTPLDEHLYEGERYLGQGSLNFHFTISNHHEDLFNRYIV